ncbi:MAG: hypothetical protein V2J24_07045 [Pseudomonadales bacterium]|jgi:hypothetical protein|nr:hypothetical protein [Pseudomonadales bacterium]
MSVQRNGFALGRVLVGAMLLLAARRRALLHAVTLPAIVLGGHAVLEAIDPERAEALAFGMLVLMIPLQVLLSVNVQRLALLGSSAVPPFGLGNWRAREWRYLGWTWLQWLLATFAFLTLAPLGAFGPPGWAVAVAGGAFVAGRLSLMLPGIAVDRPLEFREAWRRGEGAGVRLAVITVGVPVAGLLLLFPLGSAELLPVRLLGALVSLLLTCWYTAAVALAWAALGEAGGTEPAEVAADAPLRVEPDAVRGVLRIVVPRRLAGAELDDLTGQDALLAYRGRVRGVVLEVDEAFAGPEAADWPALTEILGQLQVVRVHGASTLRVALTGPAAWAPEVSRLREHFEQAELRWFPALRMARAAVWASGEELT